MVYVDTYQSTTLHVMRIMDMTLTHKGEFIACESLSGESYMVNLKGTSLEGFVSTYMASGDEDGLKLPRWAELGMRSEFTPYIEWLFTSEEFDELPRSIRYRSLDLVNGYKSLKEAHLVPSTIRGVHDLYYAQAF